MFKSVERFIRVWGEFIKALIHYAHDKQEMYSSCISMDMIMLTSTLMAATIYTHIHISIIKIIFKYTQYSTVSPLQILTYHKVVRNITPVIIRGLLH